MLYKASFPNYHVFSLSLQTVDALPQFVPLFSSCLTNAHYYASDKEFMYLTGQTLVVILGTTYSNQYRLCVRPPYLTKQRLYNFARLPASGRIYRQRKSTGFCGFYCGHRDTRNSSSLDILPLILPIIFSDAERL
jgi:hypothetical protein